MLALAMMNGLSIITHNTGPNVSGYLIDQKPQKVQE